MTRKKGQGKGKDEGGGGGAVDPVTPPKDDPDDPETHHPEDEYIVPQIVKVVSLADAAHAHRHTHATATYSNGGHRGVRSSNNILLVDNGDPSDPSQPPPSFSDNGARHDLDLDPGDLDDPPEPERILGLAYGDEEDDDFEEDEDGHELRHKFASFSLSTPCSRGSEGSSRSMSQPDDPVDYFSSSLRPSNGANRAQPLTTLPPRAASATSAPVKPGSYSRRGGGGGGVSDYAEEEDFSSCCGAIPCTSFLEEMNFCQAPDCNTPANRKCAQCKSAFYCGADHHRLDWPRHQHHCTPYRIQFVGNSEADELPVQAAVASRHIPAGQVIFSEKPMLVFPLADSQGENQLRSVMDLPCIQAQVKANANVKGHSVTSEISSLCSRQGSFSSCLGCTKVGEEPFTWDTSSKVKGSSPVTCSKCGLTLCSYNCQFLISHQAGECDAIASAKLEPAPRGGTWAGCGHAYYMDIEIMRALQLEKYDRPGWELFLEMRNSVRVEYYKKTRRFSEFVSNMEALVPFSVKISGYNADLIADVHAIINSLSYRPNLNCPFKLLFNTQPLFAHDCVPNTLQYVEEEHGAGGDGKRMKLVTKSCLPIMKLDMITLDFTPSPYLSYQRRREVLSDVLNISNCMCQRCQHPSVMNDLTGEIKCYSCQSGTVFSENFPLWKESVWSCRICQEEVSFYRIQEIEHKCELELSQILASASNTGMIRELQDWIRRRGLCDLNPKHHLIFTAWCYCESIVRSRVARSRRPDPAHVYTMEEMEHFELLGKYADIVLEHMDSIRPGIWIDKGIVQFHKFYSSFASVCRSYQHGTLSPKEFVNNVMKSLKILQQALQTLSVYEGYNAPSVLHLTHEATSVLSSVKEYMNHFLQLSDHNSNPLPPLAQVLNRAHL